MIKIIKHSDNNNMYKILIRREPVMNISAVFQITPEMNFRNGNEKEIIWRDTESSETISARFKNEEHSRQFLKMCETAIEIYELASNLGEIIPDSSD